MAYAYPINNTVGSNPNKDKLWTLTTDTNKYQNSYNQTSGPAELKMNNSSSAQHYYCLDLINKYHRESRLKSFHTVTFWFRNGLGKELTPGYETTIIRAQIPNQISYSIGGEWGSPEGVIDIGSSTIGTAFSTLWGESATSAFDVTKIWKKPKPLQVKLDIPIFDDVDSGTNVNLQEALRRFGQVILPGGKNMLSMFSVTPGPGYMTAESATDNSGDSAVKRMFKGFQNWTGNKTGLDRVTVQIGGILLIDWAIITDMVVTFPNTRQQVLHNWTGFNNNVRKFQLLPQTAVISLTVETVTGLTTLTYENMLNLDMTIKNKEDNKKKSQSSSSQSGSVQGGTTEFAPYTDKVTGRGIENANDWLNNALTGPKTPVPNQTPAYIVEGAN